MSTQPTTSTDDRIITPMPAEMVEAINEFRWHNRLPSRSAAVRELIRRGLASSERDLRLGQ